MTNYLLTTSRWGVPGIAVSFLPTILVPKTRNNISNETLVPMILTQRLSVQFKYPMLFFKGAYDNFDLNDTHIQLGVHLNESGEVMDIELVERMISLFKVLGVDKFDNFDSINCLEGEKV